MPSTVLLDQLDLKRPDDWATRPPKDSSFTESACDVEAARSQYQRVPPWVNQCTKVFSCNSLADSSLLPKSVSDVTAGDSEYSTHTGLAKTLPSSTSRSSLWIPNTMPSVTTPNINGSPRAFKNTESSAVLPPKERDHVVSARACDSSRPVDQSTLHGRQETLCLFDAKDKYLFKHLF